MRRRRIRREEQAIKKEIADELRSVSSLAKYKNGLIQSIRELGITTVIPDHILDLLILDELTSFEASKGKFWREFEALPSQDKSLFLDISDEIFDKRRDILQAQLEDEGYDVDSALDLVDAEVCFWA